MKIVGENRGKETDVNDYLNHLPFNLSKDDLSDLKVKQYSIMPQK